MVPEPTRLWPDTATILERSRGVFFAQWDELLRLRRAVIKTATLNDIHDLRVASRRFRAVLELFYPFAPKGPKTDVRKNVRTLTRNLGGLRNIDEALLFFPSRVQGEVNPENKLSRALSKLRSRELKRMKRTLKAFDHRTLDRMVREIVAGVNENALSGRNSLSLPAYFSEVSVRQYLPIHQLLAGSTLPDHRIARHSLRIAIKKWRYFFEIISLILDRDYAPVVEQLKHYQSLLGQMNDISEFSVLLGTLKLSRCERKSAEAALVAEDAVLLENFTNLSERNPLTYAFLI